MPRLNVNKKLITTLILFVGIVAVDVGEHLIEPSFIDLGILFQTTISLISKLYPVLCIFYVSGALLSGLCFKFINRTLGSGILIVIVGLAVLLIPLVAPNLIIVFLLVSLIGFGSGCYDSAVYSWIFDIWADEADFYLQVEGFLRNFTYFLSCILVSIFLTTENGLESQIGIEKKDSVRLYIPYSMCGIFALVVGVILLLLFFTGSGSGAHKSASDKTKNTEGEDSKSTETVGTFETRRRRFLGITLFAILIGSAQSVEDLFIQYITPFVYFSNLHFSKEKAAFTLSGFSGCIVVFSGLFTFLYCGKSVKTETVITSCLGLEIIGTILLLLTNTSEIILYIGLFCHSIGISLLYASTFNYFGILFNVTETLVGITLFAGSAFTTVYSTIVGTWIEGHPLLLVYTQIVNIAFMLGSYGIIRYLDHREKNGGYDVKNSVTH